MRSDKRWARGVRILLLLAMIGLPACGLTKPPEQPALKIGVIGPFDGDYAALGDSLRDAAVLAAEEWNAKGGVLGLRVELVLKNSACDYYRAREVAQEAIAAGVVFVVGAVCADASEGVAQVTAQAGVLQITPASTNLDLTLDAEGAVRPLLFRIPFVDRDQGTVAARYALDQLGVTQAAIMVADGSDYGLALAEAFRTAFEAGGGEVVDTEAYDQNAQLFYEELDGIREAAPDLIYLPGYYDVINRLATQARSYGLLQPVLLGSDGWDSPALDIQGIRGAYYTTHFYPADPRAPVRTWVDAFNTRFQRDPDALATLSYDAVNLLLTAIDQTAVEDPALVAETLATIQFDGVTGPMTFDADHNPVKPVTILAVEGQQRTYEGRFSPEPVATPEPQ